VFLKLLQLYKMVVNMVSPLRDVILLARRGVSAARSSARPARPPAGSVTDDDRRQRAKQYRPISY